MEDAFFIPEVPGGAEYCTVTNFKHIYGKQHDRVLQVVQVVDFRIAPENIQDIETLVHRPEIEHCFEIKDMQLTKPVGDTLCGVSIYDEEERNYGEHKGFSLYLNNLKDLIEIFHTIRSNEKLRVYVADNIWDRLYREKILENKHVDFVRMAASSTKTEIGHLWRILVYDDFQYPYAVTNDVDYYPRKRQSFNWVDADPSINFATPCHFSPGRWWKNPDRHNFLFHTHYKRAIYPIAQYMRSCIVNLVRTPTPLPFVSLRPILCHLLEDPGVRILYNPEMNVWTNVHESNYFYHAMDDYWLPLLSKMLKIRFSVRRRSLKEILPLIERYGNSLLSARLWRQLGREGHIIDLMGKLPDSIEKETLVKLQQFFGVDGEVSC